MKPAEPSGDMTIVTDPQHDFIPAGQSGVTSDTGELTRNWKEGIETIDTPKTKAVSGWIGGKTLKLKDASFESSTGKGWKPPVASATALSRRFTIALCSSRHSPYIKVSFLFRELVAPCFAVHPTDEKSRCF